MTQTDGLSKLWEGLGFRVFPFWVLIIIRHLIFRVPKKGTIILTTVQMVVRQGEGKQQRHLPTPFLLASRPVNWYRSETRIKPAQKV